MTRLTFRLAAVAVTTFASCAVALAQSPNPQCQRLEAQLAAIDRGNSDSARADQIRRAEAQGLDGALQTILAQPFGRFLLTAVALGFLAFGLFAILQARYRPM